MSCDDFATWAAASGHKQMPLALRASAATGGISAAVVSSVLSALNAPVPPVTCQELIPSGSTELHWPSLVLGVLLGLILGQLLEGLIVARQFLGWHIRQRCWSLYNSVAIKGRGA